jgi:hypothetical protein
MEVMDFRNKNLDISYSVESYACHKQEDPNSTILWLSILGMCKHLTNLLLKRQQDIHQVAGE